MSRRIVRQLRPPIRRRIRVDNEEKAYQPFEIPTMESRNVDRSDGSSSAVTMVTSATSLCTDPWSSSGGWIKEEEDEADFDRDHEDDDMMLVPNLEPLEDIDMSDLLDINESSIPETPAKAKRPLGRPRKHPKPSPVALAKVAKGRSKTGCITCRRRKKKCDETKPGCLNCEKNSVVCEGYPEKMLWKRAFAPEPRAPPETTNQMLFTSLSNVNVKVESLPSRSSVDPSNIAHPINIVVSAFTDLQDPPFDGQPSIPSDAAMPVDKNDAEMHSGTTGGRFPLATVSEHLPDSMEENDDLDSKGRIAEDSAVDPPLDERQPLCSPASKAQEELPNDVWEPGELRRKNEPSDISHQKELVSPECKIKEIIKIKIEDSTVDSEVYKIQSLLSRTLPINTECNPLLSNSPSSTRYTWRDSSADFETDSNCTEDESDLEKDDISSHSPDIIAMVCKQLHASSAERPEHVLDPIINPLKEYLLERIMGDFWTLFNQEWSENVRRRTGSPSTPSSSVSDPSSASSKRSAEKSNKKHKRARDDNGGHRPDEDENEDPKRPRHASACPEGGEDSQQKFACPYRKHNPRKYSHCGRRWRSCALTPFSTIARVKGHLYRHHRTFQCRRCNEVFKDEDALQSHFMAINPCALQESVPAEGITPTLEKQLRNRKKTSSTQSQEERWQDIYRILFPMEIVQGAFFEPVQDETNQSPVSFELSNYEEFSRQELPRVFRGALEAVINTAAQPLEEQLRSHLVSIVQECQDRVFSSYRTRNSSSPAVSRTALAQPTSFPGPIPISSLHTDLGNLSSLSEERPEDILDNLYQRPPYQSRSLSNPDFHDRQQAPKPARRDETSESGYVSDFSALNASGSTSQDTGIDLTTSNSSSGIQSQSQPTEDHADTNNGNAQSFAAYTDGYTAEGLSPHLPEDFSDMYVYGSHSWEAPFLP